jgi:hypothetical protein
MMTKIAIGLGLLVAACSTDAGLDDGRDDTIALGGKGDGSLTLTPAELSKILQEASLSGAAHLHDDVGLSTNAAAALEAKAKGPDGHLGSLDDTYFRTVAELDAVPYIGPYAMGKLKDYVHSAGIVGDTMSDKWSVESQVAYTIPRSNDPWDSDPVFAIERDGAFVALYQVGIHTVVLSIDGQVIDLPVADQSVAYQELAVAVDETNAIHVFYLTWTNAARFKHMTYKAGQWTDLGTFDGDSLTLASNGAGAIYGLVRGQRWVGSALVDFTELHHFGATAAQSSAEPLPGTVPMFGTDPAAIGVGADGLPVITWLHGTCKDRSCPVDSLQLLRGSASGFTTSSVAGDPMWSRSVGLTTGGGPNATIVMTGGSTFDGVTRVVKESAGTFVTAPAVTNQGLVVGVGWLYSVALDAQGTLHGCGIPRSTAWINELEVDGTGASTGTPIMNGGETSFCAVVNDASQGVHLIYGNRSVFLQAARQ